MIRAMDSNRYTDMIIDQAKDDLLLRSALHLAVERAALCGDIEGASSYMGYLRRDGLMQLDVRFPCDAEWMIIDWKRALDSLADQVDSAL